MSIKPEALSKEIEKTLDDFVGATEDDVMKALQETANDAVTRLQSAHPPGSGKYGSWSDYNKGWERTKVKASKGRVFSEVIHNKTHYQLAHLLEKGHAIRGGGRAKAFEHIAPVEKEAEDKLIQSIKQSIKN